MSFRRALFAIALCALAPAPGWADDGRMVEGGYEITFAGFTGFRIDFTARVDSGGYDVESHAFKEGVLKHHYELRGAARQTATPRARGGSGPSRW